MAAMLSYCMVLLLFSVSNATHFSLKTSGDFIGHNHTSIEAKLHLERKAGEDEVILNVFNYDLLQYYHQELIDVIECRVKGGHMRFRKNKKWERIEVLDLHKFAKPKSITSKGNNTRIEIPYDVEGILTCYDIVGIGLVSNSVLLRFTNTRSTVVELLVPPFVEVHDVIINFSWSPHFPMQARLLRAETLGDGSVIVVARVSYDLRPWGEDVNVLISFVRKVSSEVAEKFSAILMSVKSTCCCPKKTEGGFHWPAAPYGRTVLPVNPCLDDSGFPGPSRRCLGDFIVGVDWEVQYATRPRNCAKLSYTALKLRNMIDNAHTNASMNDLLDLVEGKVLPANEITLLSNSLMKFAQIFTRPGVNTSAPPIEVVAKIVNTVLDSGRDAIGTAEKDSGSAKDILDTVDELVGAAAMSSLQINAAEQHISLLTVPKDSHVKGVLAVAMDGDPERVRLLPISCNDSVEDILMKSPRSAAFLLDCPESKSGLASTLFQDDSLFVARDADRCTIGSVVGMSFWKDVGISSEIEAPVLIIFPKENRIKSQCSFWDKKAQIWSGAGCESVELNVTKSEVPGDFNACLCTHLTHFGMLFSQDPSELDGCISEKNGEDPFHMLTLITCSVSLACLLCIFIVAAVFRNWRRGVGRKLQLHISASLALLMATNITVQIYPRPIDEGSPGALCVFLGVLLHYSLLTTFSWMLVVAVLQAIRLSPRSILDSRSRTGNHLVLKTSIFGWGIPLIPVIVILLSGSKVYALRRGTSLCYPRGVALYASVVAPVGLVIVVNTLVFVAIFRNIFYNDRSGMRVHEGDKMRLYLKRASFALFLFCLFGLNWGVGLVLPVLTSNKTAYKIVAYIFCSTATLQGASLFFFFVVCERNIASKMIEEISKWSGMWRGIAARFIGAINNFSTTSDRTVSEPVNS